jgi:Domain of unknown function (DUF1911)/Domain of unknown function (DUF1910)
MRVTDPIGGVPDLDRFFRDYDEHFSRLDHYSYQLRHMTACYSRGDSMRELRAEFPELVRKIELTGSMNRTKYPGSDPVFVHHGRYLESFRDSLVVLSLGLCLRVPHSQISTVLSYCERGDPLLETLAGAAGGSAVSPGAPAFYETFDRLYDALIASGPEREECVRGYLNVWYSEKMDGLSIHGTHLTEDQADYVGYWCFEAAGVVAALNMNDRTFADHPHYPGELVAFYRSGERQ